MKAVDCFMPGFFPCIHGWILSCIARKRKENCCLWSIVFMMHCAGWKRWRTFIIRPVNWLMSTGQLLFLRSFLAKNSIKLFIYVWNIMGRLWGVLILQSIRKITIRTRYNRYIYQLKIIVSIFHDRELLSTYLVSSKGMLWKQLKAY